MDQSSNQGKTAQPQTLLKWEFPSYIKHERTLWWYVVASALALGLFIWTIFDKNYLYSIIIIVVAIIIVAQQIMPPQRILFQVTEDGITIGNQLHRFSEFNTFWIAYEPPTVKQLYLEFKRGLRPSYSIPLLDENPLRIRAVLQRYIREDLERETEDLTDRLGRKFKI